MLTHVPMFVYTLWCWHTLRRRWSLKGREMMGWHTLWCWHTLRGWALFEKMKCIFSIAPVGNLEKSRECFTHRTLASGAPEAESERPVQTVPGPARVRHRTIGTGRWLERPVARVRCAGVLRPSLRMGPVSTGRYRCLASGDPASLRSSLRTGPVCTGLLSVRCSAGYR